MADTDKAAGNTELHAHERTYNRLIAWLSRGAIICFVIAFVVIWLISGR